NDFGNSDPSYDSAKAILNNENTHYCSSSRQALPYYETEPEAEPLPSQHTNSFSS
ncbi:11613_t:CDS:1, partial [Racocetra persica]